ncbi:hypothetical protein [Pantoea agglomerans]|uniref:hypothetical protein n=1 Tax=Enterobacter agglomerans TaxID=549 RepID=UPI002413AB0F|nr:hypothetical protein [Pantoea agglomerans]
MRADTAENIWSGVKADDYTEANGTRVQRAGSDVGPAGVHERKERAGQGQGAGF